MFPHTGPRKTKPLRVLISPSTVMAWCESRTTRFWSAPAECTSTNSPLMSRAATCPSSLWYILVSSVSIYFNMSHLHRKEASLLSRCSGGDKACSSSKLSGGQWHDDANPVRVAICQHEGYQQDHQHLPAAARRFDFHCEWTDLCIHPVPLRDITFF